jgi:integrase
MASAWIYQDTHQIKKHGEEAASWYVGWIDPEGKRRCQSCGPSSEGKRNAEKLRKKREAELITGTYQSNARKTWDEFRAEYEEKVLPKLAEWTRHTTLISLDHFQRIIRPVRMAAIKTTTIDEFAAKRRQEDGKKKGSKVSPATVNKDLRHVRAAIRKAKRWGYLSVLPEFDMEREPRRLVCFVTAEHFAAIYAACDRATMPGQMPYPAADWWRGLLVTAYMTGWRISDLLGLRGDDLDLDNSIAITRWEDNKCKRDDRVKLHPVVVEHLRKLPGDRPTAFPWSHTRKTLDIEFGRIQQAAGIHLHCPDRHEHTPACHLYGFHDLRRAFATMNADRLTGDALQLLMRHKSYQTTQVYINMARQMDEAVEVLYVPEVLREKDGGKGRRSPNSQLRDG